MLVITAGILLLHTWSAPDIWYHRSWDAESSKPIPPNLRILCSFKNTQFINVYWLFQVICVGVYRLLGVLGVTLLFSFLWLSILGLYVWNFAISRWKRFALPMTLVLLLVLRVRFEERPEVFSYLCLVLRSPCLSDTTASEDGPAVKSRPMP